jgi:hypothetical protein
LKGLPAVVPLEYLPSIQFSTAFRCSKSYSASLGMSCAQRVPAPLSLHPAKS